MRPNRTLPLVLSLAVLAALPLLSGCVEEELEPGYELLEVGPELPEGVSASPDGSIVIGKALAVPEGFTLGEEDWEALAVMNNFECYSIWVVPSEEYCKWFKHGCGTGGEGADWKHHVYLDCPLSVQRGSTATCTIRTGDVNLNLLRVDVWWTDLGGPNQYGGMTWGGVATTTAMIKVALSMEMIGESVVLEDVVIVTPRAGWSLQEQRARLQWVRGEPIGDSAWGVYVGGWPTPQTLAGTVPGSGPWAGSHILSVAPPTITATAMYAHRDLLSDGEPYPIPLTDTICGLSGSSVGVHNLNITCGYKRSLETFRDAVAIHEGRHQESLNECVRAVNTDGRLAAVEAIVGTFPGHAEDQALTLWTNGLVPALLKAKRTAQGPVSGDIWHWRQFSKWRYGGKTVGHTGTEGCPPIT